RKTQRSYLQTNPFQNGVNYRTDLSIHQRSLLVTESIIGINPINNLEFTETITQFEYDKYSTLPLIPHNFNPLDNSRNPAYGTGYQTRGNTTGIIRGNTNNQSILNSQYDIAGNLIKTLGPLSNQEVSTEYDSEHFAFPIKTTQIVSGAPQPFVLERTYDLSTGVILSSSGLNKLAGETTNYFYNDLLDRLTRVVRPIGAGESNYIYSDASTYPSTVNTSSKLDNTRNLVSTTFYDGLLNPIKSTRQDPKGDVTSETTYDGFGRLIKVTNPQRAVTSDDTSGYTQTAYDGFGRIVNVESFTASGSSTGKVLSVYNGSDVEVTDQAGHKRKSVIDALGRLVSVFEPDPNGALSLETKYNYDTRGNLLKVEQGVQTRTFVYDSLGRLINANVPESGSISYNYDAASNLLARTDARAITTTYTYDSLNRIKTKNYSDSTPDVSYFYDVVPSALPTGVFLPPNFSFQNTLGRATGMATPTTTNQNATAWFHTYDVGGRTTKNSQLLNGRHYTTENDYNLASLPTQHIYPSGKVIAHNYNIAGQITQITRNGFVLSNEMEYTASGAVSLQNLGNSLHHSIKYNSRLQPTTISLGTSLLSAPNDKMKIDYSYGTLTESGTLQESKNNGNIARINLLSGAGSEPITQDFKYDELNRLSKA
ncbi:MAG: RHS repeat-associated core domain-containing protein, partial [bacterium]